MYFFLFFKDTWKNISRFPQKYIQFLGSKSAYYSKMSSACDTEDWSNCPENSALSSQE